MTSPVPVDQVPLDEIDLTDIEGFWTRPMSYREGAFLTLREQDPIRHFPERGIEVDGEVVLPPGPGYWAVTRHADIIEASRRPELFCSGKGFAITDLPPEFNEFFGSMLALDDPRHARLRRIVSAGFTPRMLARIEDQVQSAASRIVDEVLETGGGDFVTDVAARLPLQIICDMMGIPDSQYQFVLDKTNIILSTGDNEYIPEGENPLEWFLAAGAELAALMDDLAEQRRSEPTDDLTSALLHAEIEGESLSNAELNSFFVLLCSAGNETTRNAISHGVDTLTRFPDQKAIWQADFEGTAATAVEEIVRWASPVIHFRRTVTRDGVRLGDHTFAEGDKVVLFYPSANRDTAVFDDPFTFDVRRSPNDHVGFGGPGPHFCLGAHLARREITVMFRELFGRLPDIRSVGEPVKLRSNFIHGIKHLTYEFTPGGGS